MKLVVFDLFYPRDMAVYINPEHVVALEEETPTDAGEKRTAICLNGHYAYVVKGGCEEVGRLLVGTR